MTERNSRRFSGRRVALIVCQVGASAGLLWFALASVDGESLKRALLNVSVVIPLIALLTLVLAGFVQSVRWHIVMHSLGGELGVRQSLSIVMLSLFYNQVLPSTVGGDAIRVWMARRASTSIATVIHGVIVDRVTGLWMLAFLAAIGWPFLLMRTGPILPTLGVGVVSIGALAAAVAFVSIAALPEVLISVPLVRHIVGLARSFWRCISSARVAFTLAFLALTAHSLTLFAIVMIGKGVGLQIAALDYVLVVPAVLIVSVVPISVAGWGVREGAMAIGLGLLGVEREQALALSVLFGGLSLATGFVGAVTWYAVRQRSQPASQTPFDETKRI